MNAKKQERLRSKGWSVGDAAEFLALSPEEALYVEVKAAFCSNLRQERERRKMTQAELAKRLGSSQSRVAKMEAGDPSVSIDLLLRGLCELGVSRQELSRIIA